LYCRNKICSTFAMLLKARDKDNYAVLLSRRRSGDD
jgi:hypothetical protein